MLRNGMIIFMLIGFNAAAWSADHITSFAAKGAMFNNRTSREPMKNTPLNVYEAGYSSSVLGSVITDTTGFFILTLFPAADRVLSSRDTLCITCPEFTCSTSVRDFSSGFTIYSDTRELAPRNIPESALVDGDSIEVTPGNSGSYFPAGFFVYPPIDSIIKPEWVTMDDCTGFCVKILPPPGAPSVACKFFKRINDSILYEFDFFVKTGIPTSTIEKPLGRTTGLSPAPTFSVNIENSALRVVWSQAEPQSVGMRLYGINGMVAATTGAVPFGAGTQSMRIPLQRRHASGIYILEVLGGKFTSYQPVRYAALP